MMNQQDEEQPGEVRRGRGRPRKNAQPGRRGRPRKSNKGPYQARGLKAPYTKFVAPPTQIRTRLRAGAAPKEYRQGINKPRNSSHQDEEDEDEYEDDHNEVEEDEDEEEGEEEENDDLDHLGSSDDSDGQPSGSHAGVSHRGLNPNRHQINQDDVQMDDGSMHIDNEDFEHFAADDYDLGRVIPKASGKRSREENPDLGSSRAAKHARNSEGLALGYARGQPSSSGHPVGSLSEMLEVRKLRIHTLFPDSASYLAKGTLRGSYWSPMIEIQFQRLWRRYEHGSRFVQGPRADSDELELWKMISIRYRTILPHLFTYGLKLGEDCYEAPGSIMLSSNASFMLQKICAHPLWGCTFNSLRFVLQTAVKLSVGEHFDPIGALPVTDRMEDYHKSLITEHQHNMIFSNLHYRLWLDTKPDNEPQIRHFVEELERHIKPAPGAPKEPQSRLFILTADVMEGVLKVLEEYGRPWYSSPRELVEQFRHYYSEGLALVEPLDNKQLMDIKWELELQQLRDIEIRKVMRKLGLTDAFLYDIPHLSTKHTYRVPLYHYDPQMDQRALPALRGEVVDPKRTMLHELDRQSEDRAKALDEFTGKMMHGRVGLDPAEVSFHLVNPMKDL
ncbi:hypothetical protein F4859DRAFT_521712 [Xylaria cf. heliscus]|nr:hypothetical protein F4859DRAFT_521712 [Xylaria cf. heliscus]